MRKIAFVFPGQGSQTVGMLAAYAALYPVITTTFARASSMLGYDLWKLVQEGPEEKLNYTEYAQPALLAAGFAIWCVWRQLGGCVPILLAGHSLGEYTALVCAEVLSFEDAVLLVSARGRITQEAVPAGEGAMAAIVGLEETQIADICVQARRETGAAVLQPANYNSIGQIVIAGEIVAVQRAVELAQAQKAKIAKVLSVSIPSHCLLMRDAAECLREKLEKIDFSMPKISVINNVDVAIYSDANKIKDALLRQLYSPVRWVETIQLMQQHGVDGIFECGHGKVLTGLNKRIVNNTAPIQVVIETFSAPQNLQQALSL